MSPAVLGHRRAKAVGLTARPTQTLERLILLRCLAPRLHGPRALEQHRSTSTVARTAWPGPDCSWCH
eukprot:9332199-Alexandrium_andersonii.AAC.2